MLTCIVPAQCQNALKDWLCWSLQLCRKGQWPLCGMCMGSTAASATAWPPGTVMNRSHTGVALMPFETLLASKMGRQLTVCCLGCQSASGAVGGHRQDSIEGAIGVAAAEPVPGQSGQNLLHSSLQ